MSTKVALVTGGSRGIGRAVARALLERGWQVEISSRRESSLAEAIRELGASHGAAVGGRPLDVRDPEAVEAWVREVHERHGRLDCLVNNAGLGRFAPVTELTVESWRAMIDTNLTGAFLVLRAAARVMVEAGSGWIFNIASLAGKSAIAGGAAYNASKFGVVGLSEAAMLDLRKHGVRVTTILPGSVDTDFFQGQVGEQGWMLQPDDIAQTVVGFLEMPLRALPSWVEIRPTFPKG